MNRAKIEALIKQYKTDAAIIFAMPAIVQEIPCGTAMCYAGQVCANAGYELRKLEPEAMGALAFREGGCREAIEIAEMELELSHSEALRLFVKNNWPQSLYDQPDTPALAAERLQRFLDTNGRE